MRFAHNGSQKSAENRQDNRVIGTVFKLIVCASATAVVAPFAARNVISLLTRGARGNSPDSGSVGASVGGGSVGDATDMDGVD